MPKLLPRYHKCALEILRTPNSDDPANSCVPSSCRRYFGLTILSDLTPAALLHPIVFQACRHFRLMFAVKLQKSPPVCSTGRPCPPALSASCGQILDHHGKLCAHLKKLPTAMCRTQQGAGIDALVRLHGSHRYHASRGCNLRKRDTSS